MYRANTIWSSVSSDASSTTDRSHSHVALKLASAARAAGIASLAIRSRSRLPACAGAAVLAHAATVTIEKIDQFAMDASVLERSNGCACALLQARRTPPNEVSPWRRHCVASGADSRR